MPSLREPVYQPTTVSVSYEPRPAGNGGGGTPSYGILNKPFVQLGLLILALVTVALGTAILASSIADWLESTHLANNKGNQSNHADIGVVANTKMPFGITAGGIIIILTGLFLMGMYLKLGVGRRNRLCGFLFFDKKQSQSRQLQFQCSDGSEQATIALNPATNPSLPHRPYSTSALTFHPEDEEYRNLMTEVKDCFSSAEESDRMLEPDPRIVLRPMGRIEDA